jgi:hypothetical protein
MSNYLTIPKKLGNLMKAGRVELFINVMWREPDILIQQRPAPRTPHAQTRSARPRRFNCSFQTESRSMEIALLEPA